MNRELTQTEKDELVQLNSKRLDFIRRLPWRKQQSASDRLVQDLNICLTMETDSFLDLAILADQYVTRYDRSPVIR